MRNTTPRKGVFMVQGRTESARAFVNALANPERHSYAFIAKMTQWTRDVEITSISQTNPAFVTAYKHGFSNGDLIVISNALGMTQINGYGGVPLVVANAGLDTFELSGIDSTGFSTYTGGGVASKLLDSKWPDPEETLSLGNATRGEIMAAKRINPADARLVIPRNDWKSGVVYDFADYTDQTLQIRKFHVITSANRVYKCVWNNNGAVSTVEPTGTSISDLKTPDGYVWKYMCTISEGEMSRFATKSWIPVKTLEFDDGQIQWDVQNAAIPGTVSGVTVVRGGESYDSSATVVVDGDGIGAEVRVAPAGGVVDGSIVKLQVVNPGKNYTWAKAHVVHPNGFASSLNVVLSSIRGHGADVEEELLARHVMISVPFEGDEGGKFPVDSAFRKCGILSAPLTRSGEPAKASVYDCRTRVTITTPTAPFAIGETVTHDNGTAVVQSKSSGTLQLVDVVGSLSSGMVLTGSEGSVTISSVTLPDLNAYTGSVAYLEHRGPTTRRSNRQETFKVVLEF